MKKVTIINDNTHPFSQEFKGEMISIPPGGSVEMEYYDGYEFYGAYSPIKTDGDGNHLPSSYKKLRVVEQGKPENIGAEHKCFAVGCKFQGTTAKELESHSATAHAGEAIVDELAEKEIKTKKKAG